MTYDVVVLGAGGVGSAALYHLAQRGAKVLGLDRFPPAHDRGSSHGRTRIIRQAYYEHPDYVPLTFRAYELWDELQRHRGEQLLHEVGLLQVGPTDGAVLSGVRESARRHRLRIEELSADEIAARWGGFRVPPALCGLFEPRAGYLRVEACVAAHLAEAQRLGAELRTDEPAISWHAEGEGISVTTERGTYTANNLAIAAGAWSGELLADLGVRLEVRRKHQYWFSCDDRVYRAEAGCPNYLFETPAGIFYGFPRIDEWGVKIARHSGGDVVSDPLNVNREIDPADLRLVEQFLAAHLPGIEPRLLHHSVCMYTMTPDEHFLVDRHPQHRQVAFVAGLSGHGFKFTPVLGEALADLTTSGTTNLPIGFLNCQRAGLRA